MIRLGVSQRRACQLASLGRSSFAYRVRQPDEADLSERLRQIALKYPRFGYRRAWALLRRAGLNVNHKRVWRLWKQLKLACPKKTKRRRRGQGTVPRRATHPNHVWTYDFVHDTCLSGRKFKMLTVMDEFTREGLAIHVGTSLPSSKVRAVLNGLFAEHGRPQFLRSDNGPEFIAQVLKAWLMGQEAETMYIDPGCPWQNGFGESFNGKVRDECLNAQVFVSVAEAGVVTEAWRVWYNQERPHSSLHYQTPLEFKQAWQQSQDNDHRV